MIKKKKGFTLIELLVTILCTSIIFEILIASVLYINRLNKNIIKKSSNLFKIQELSKIIINNFDGIVFKNEYVITKGNIYHNNKLIIQNTTIDQISFLERDNFIICSLLYDNTIYQFIVGEGVLL